MRVLTSINLILFFFNIKYEIIETTQCRDENNEAVDWFIMYKIPKMKHTNNLIEKGVGYIYITSSNYSQWTLSQSSINDSDSMIGNTLNPLYNNSNNIAFVFYNDQPPAEPTKSQKGHTKGMILADLIDGFWLIHSVPHFPQAGDQYKFPSTGVLKGQSFLCISLDLKNLNKVGIQLQYNEAQIFSSNVPNVLATKLNQIVKAISGDTIEQPPWYNKMSINSGAGVPFVSFAKSKKFGKDLYEDWVAPALQTNLLVESWLNGPGRLLSNCSKVFKVYNIESISMKVAEVDFKDSQDHSKWAVSENSTWICIGDINRMEHQKFRGGGTVCLNNMKLAHNYQDYVASIEKCHN